jgi:hypothetical protein
VVCYWIVFLNFVSFTVPEEAADFERHCDNQLYHQKRRNVYNGGIHVQVSMDSSYTLYIGVVTFFISLMYFLLAAEMLQTLEVLDLLTSGMFPPAYFNIFKIIQNLTEDEAKDGVFKTRIFVKLYII